VLCEQAGRVVPATVVDHIVPHRGVWELFVARDNLRGVCVRCNATKANREDRGPQ
jgi:5-methylcytosine-specific restriction protein A